MARLFGHIKLDHGLPQTPDQFRNWDHVRYVLGAKPYFIRTLTSDPGQQGTSFIKWRIGLGEGVELICARGMLVGIPPKGQGQK